MSAEVNAAGGSLMVAQITQLFPGMNASLGYVYDVAKDGKSFLVALPPDPSSNAQSISVVQNWTATLRK